MMKLHRLFLTIILITLVSTLSFAQNKYMKTYKGAIVDTATYTKMKETKAYVTKSFFIGNNTKVTIADNFKEIRRTADSIVYTYKWDIKVITEKGDIINVFDPDYYIDKEFPLPILKTLDNTEISINELKGKPTLINFWFTTCKPCIEEMPPLDSIKSALSDSVNFLAITFEPKKKVKAFLKKHSFTFMQIPDAKKFTNALNMDAFPVNIILDKNGIVKKIGNGIPYISDGNGNIKIGDGKELLAALKELL